MLDREDFAPIGGRGAHHVGAKLVVAEEADSYGHSLPGLELDVVRTGPGSGPNLTRSGGGDGFHLAAGRVGFPVLGRTTVGDDRSVVALVTRAPPGSRWCEIDLEPGTVLAYGPGAEHTAISPEGVTYTLMVIDSAMLEAAADDMGTPLRGPGRGTVTVLARSPDGQVLASLLRSVESRPLDDADVTTLRPLACDSVVAALADTRFRSDRDRHIDSGHLVNECLDHLEAWVGVPSLAELCGRAHVSERRLRTAFVDTLGVPPRRYLQSRLLNLARQRLLDPADPPATVQEVALDLGFGNLGRFSHRYRELFDEKPSATLAAGRGTRGPRAGLAG
jgi:AraC family ethanolamine operon transcriptional activator